MLHISYLFIFIHSAVNGHLGCFHVLAMVSSAAMNMRLHESFQIMFFCSYMPGSWIAGLYNSCTLNLHTPTV